MTHVPDCDKAPKRTGKMFAVCGAEVSIRKAVTAFPTCPHCDDLNLGCLETLQELFGNMSHVVAMLIDRGCFIRAQKALSRKRWRK